MLGDYRGGDDRIRWWSGRYFRWSCRGAEPIQRRGLSGRIAECHGISRLGTAAPLPAPVRHPQLRSLRRSDYEVAIRGDEIFIAGTNQSGTRVYRPAPSDAWEEFDKLQPLDSHMGGGVTTVIEKNHLFLMQRNWNAEREAYVINVFRKNAPRRLRARGHTGLERRRDRWATSASAAAG